MSEINPALDPLIQESPRSTISQTVETLPRNTRAKRALFIGKIKKKCRLRSQIQVEMIVSHEADQKKGMDRYIHLCLKSNHPMEYVARENKHIGDTIFFCTYILMS